MENNNSKKIINVAGNEMISDYIFMVWPPVVAKNGCHKCGRWIVSRSNVIHQRIPGTILDNSVQGIFCNACFFFFVLGIRNKSTFHKILDNKAIHDRMQPMTFLCWHAYSQGDILKLLYFPTFYQAFLKSIGEEEVTVAFENE